MATKTVYLADAQRLLSLFTQGLAGRYLHLKSTEELTGQFRPAGATTDGLAIYLLDLSRLVSGMAPIMAIALGAHVENSRGS